ncbi:MULTISPECIES: DUF6358 family protein [Sphingobacterium]|uniref:DUF6358 family protein n=1 Tax=Sphingobacterium tenebrionis TaxID=3111775 RepID=A0ABU8I1A5_9SPHI|nr:MULTISPECIES: DUF6358 family protein [unclassified Sphingobacterium]QBR13792.1 sortase [Sphingobacterium sp. CZ-2]
MTKKFILNIVLNLFIVFLVLSGWAAFNSGNMLILGISIALMVVLIYLKVVLLKQVKREVKTKQNERFQQQQQSVKHKKGARK